MIVGRWLLAVGLLVVGPVVVNAQQVPELTKPVNDFADVIDAANENAIDRISRALLSSTGDVLIVATVPTVEPFADIREFAVKLFQNNGRGIGQRGKDNGVLILVAVRERKVWVEVGYDLEQWITDGFAGETSRDYMVPSFRTGNYGEGLLRGATRIAGRIAQGRNVSLDGVPPPERTDQAPELPLSTILIMLFVFFLIARAAMRPRRGIRRWGNGGWSGWSSGVGPFGGGWVGRGGGGGFGGGFGGFGGGRSGGGGGGAGW
jgi:uncharacterized protein